MKTPDALFVPETWKTGETQLDRIDSILAIAEPLLDVDRSRGGRAYIRRHTDGRRLFVTADPSDTLNFPAGHPRAGSPRYDWIDQPDGSEHGFLTEERAVVEERARRPGFVEGPRVVLGDGQAWAFPRPVLRLYPVRADDGRLTVGGGLGYGADYADLVDQLVDCDPGDTTARLALQFQMAASLLGRNYTLSDRDLRRLLAIDLADPACEPRWAQINEVLLARPPKPSADGSATPCSPAGSPGT